MSPQAGFLLETQVLPRLRSDRRGKEITAGNITFYTIAKLRCGRRSTGSSVVDVHASRTQLNGTTRLTSLEDVAAIDEETGGEIYFHDILSRDEEDPSTRAEDPAGRHPAFVEIEMRLGCGEREDGVQGREEALIH